MSRSGSTSAAWAVRWPPTAGAALPSRVEFTTDLTLDLLARRGITATFFVLGWIAERHPRLVERILAAGHEVASHGWSHRRVYELDEVSFEDELTRTGAALEAAGAPRPIGFRAPEWSINDRSLWALAVLARLGFRYDSSMSPLRLVGNPEFPEVPHRRDTAGGALLEVPPLVGRRFGQQLSARRRVGAADEPARDGREGDRRAQSRAGNRSRSSCTRGNSTRSRRASRCRGRCGSVTTSGWRGFAERLDDILASADFGPIGDWALTGDGV